MNVEYRGGMKNASNTAGFVNIEDYEGVTMRISKELLKQCISSIENINGELDNEYIRIGISNTHKGKKAKLFCVFLDSKKTLAYAVAGADEE